MSILHIVSKIVLENPTFLLSDNIRIDVRSNVDYSLLNMEYVEWFESFLIPVLEDFKAICDSIIKFAQNTPNLSTVLDQMKNQSLLENTDKESQLLQEQLKKLLKQKEITEKLSSKSAEDSQRFRTKLKSINDEIDKVEKQFFSVYAQSEKLKRDFNKEKVLVNTFATLDEQTMLNIERLKTTERIDNFTRQSTELKQECMASGSTTDEMLRFCASENLKGFLMKLYIKIRSNKFNIRTLISQEEIESQLESFQNEEENPTQTKSSKKKTRSKGSSTSQASSSATLPEHQQHSMSFSSFVIKQGFVRDETKLYTYAEKSLDSFDKKITSLQRRIENFEEEHLRDAKRQAENNNEDTKKRGIINVNLYKKIIRCLKSELKILELNKQKMLVEKLMELDTKDNWTQVSNKKGKEKK